MLLAAQLQERGNIRMRSEYCEIEGEVVTQDRLRIERAKLFVNAVEFSDFTHLIECKQTSSGDEVIVFNAEAEIGQIIKHDIKYLERIAVRFDASDAAMPEVLALRCDFPSVPHINLTPEEFPRSLCVTEQEFSEWKLRSTGVTFVREILHWLEKTAKGTLHADDQPLEPLLLGSEGFIVLPHDLFANNVDSEPLFLSIKSCENDRNTYIAKRPKDSDESSNVFEYVAFSFLTKAQTHGIIRWAPKTILELHKFLESSNTDLVGQLRKKLCEWKEDNTEQKYLDRRLALIIQMPKMRADEPESETVEVRAFLTFETIKEVGVEIGIWEESDGNIGYLISIDEKKAGKKIRVGMLNPVSSLSSKDAALYNDVNNVLTQQNKKVAAVGLGALGSQVFMNLIRAGYGKWILIDEDLLLPHNLSRHALPGVFVGEAKSHWMAELANHTIDEEPIADWIVADVLNPSESPETQEKIKEAFNIADIILDASASVSVARHLANNVKSSARRISIFLNPDGTDVTVLAEDIERKIKLDSLEMQYYRNFISRDCLEGHLPKKHPHNRYGASCRDVSATIPQDYVALHAAICSRTIHKLTSNEQAFMSIWRIDEDQINVKSSLLPVRNSIICKKRNWTLCTDEGFIEKIQKARSDKPANETGGVLVGSYDIQRKIVYVVDYLPSPPDSEEYPTHYIRGCQGLRAQVEKIHEMTEKQIEYIGEWHSHPPNCGVKPSQDDRKVFQWISDFMTAEGLPPLMLIVGDHKKYAFYLEEMD